ncbi:hypothetical protein [Pseudomonas botevensis]|uniref:hypothetical protein n=1 Tax=Pseudomonas botevensis TaxID=2842352 RepID=UPI001C3D977A|nr:hypothetical protein [Pseudomonas botevensis]MBV4476867.1 hypothetical protein [Pseudomonas botevensis]
MNIMRVVCQANTGASVPEDIRYRGETDRTEFAPLRIGVEYIVYGLMFMCGRIDFLLCSDSTGPYWMPHCLFTVLDKSILPWEICLSGQSQDYEELFSTFGISALVGYESLVCDYQHYLGILERDPVHLQRFFEEKKIIDQQCNP